MRNPVTVLSTLLSVEFVLYTVCLCSPQWLVQREGEGEGEGDGEGASEGLFTLCDSYQGFSSCTTFPAWVGTYSLSWMFLSGSSLLSLAAALSVRPALTRGGRAVAALLLNISSAALCAGALISFLVSIEEHVPQLLQFLGWTFYICCASLFYASVVSVLLGVVQGDSARVGPAGTGAGGPGGTGLSVIAA